MGKKIVTRTTVTLVHRESLASYGEDTVEQAIAYEHGKDRPELLQGFIEGLEFADESDITITHVAAYEDVEQ